MCRMKLRFVGAGLVAVLSATLAVWGGHEVAAQGVKIKPGAEKDKGKEKTKSIYDENIPFEYPEERDAKNQLKAARDYLEFNDIPWKTVCPLLQNILDAKSDSFFVFKEQVGDREEIRRISVKTEANRIISAFPKAGLEFYQQLYGAEGERILKGAVEGGYDLATLSDLSQRYFHTRAGGEATVLLGTIHLDRGNYLEAAHAFERLLARPASEELLTSRTLFKAALAFRRSGDPKHTDLAKTTWEKAERPIARDGLTIGRRTFTLDQLRAELDRPVQFVRASTTVGDWPMRLGNAARNATALGGPPFLDPAFRPAPMLPGDDEANAWIKSQLERLFNRESTTATKTGLPLPAFFPLTAQDKVIFRTYAGVSAVATRDHTVHGALVRAGDLMWRQMADVGLHQLMTTGGVGDDIQARSDAMAWWAQYPQLGVSSILFENPLLGSLAHDGQNVYFVDDVAIPPPPVFSSPEFGIQGGASQYRQSGALANAIRAGRLVAVNMQTGKVAWELGRLPPPPRPDDKANAPPPAALPVPPRLSEDDADKTTSAFQLCLDAVFLGPPLPLHGKLYVVVEQAGVMRLLCLDPRVIVPGFPGRREMVPTLVWSQRLGKPNNTLPQDSVRRYQGVFLAAADGIMICPTNSGVVVAVDTMSRSLLWGRAYKKQPPAPTRPTYDPMTGRPTLPQQLQNNRWRASAPVISGGRVVVTAYDSDKIECLDLRSGRLVWEVPRKAEDLYLGGVVGDKVIVVGQDRVRAYHLHKTEENAPNSPQLAWESSEAIPTPTGHGAAGKATYFVPVRQPNAGRESVPAAEIWAINVETGKVESKTLARKRGDNTELARYGLGNLVFQDGQVYAQSAWEVAVFPQLEEKRREMDRRLAANPKDPVGLTDRGELDLDDGKRLEAVGHFKEALKNNPSEGTRWRIREKLYVAYTEILKDNFAAGEPFLDEYKALCEVPLDTDDPDERAQRQDETLRRQRLFLYLLAKGREKQGKLGEAFDHYLSLAGLGEGKTLLEMPDEPNVRMRPDVWARGRIEGMIRLAADPTARKSLEDRVNKEWAGVKGGNDLGRLREFVGVFGPYFPAGSEAQFTLAEKLLATNNEADAREAQMHLAQLRVTAEQRDVRARAAETLARLMVKHGQMEDAVGLYLQIGKEFPDVVVRDGKTGADLLTDLLTDRRLLPYLEPSRYPLPSRVKVEQKDGGGFVGGGSMIEIDPDGDLLPMYRRLRFSIDTGASGNGQWAIRAFDRVTGAERARFTDLMQPNMPYGQPNISLSKYVQANGHLLLVQLGSWVYCLDLSERKERWRKNLLGDAVTGNPALRIEESNADGDVTVKDAEGYLITLGRAAVIQPGYVCLLTRDGLEVVEPTTRRQLWVRRGVPNRTQVYGDARYVVLIEMGADKKPISAKLLRAVDGMPVEGVADAGPLLGAAKAYRVMGSRVLLTDGGGDAPRVLRLYDLAAGKDVWRKEFDAKSVPVKAVNPDWAGFARPDGEVEVVSVATGETVTKLRIDAAKVSDHMKGCVQAQVFADPDRFYVVLDRDASATPAAGGQIIPNYNYALRTHKVNGPMYAFDRATGKRLWCQDEAFENQMLVLEQFADLPVVIAVAAQRDRNGANAYRVVVVEKERGLLRFHKPLQFTAYYFQSLQVDLKNGTVDLLRQDLRIHVSPDAEAKKPGQ